MNQLHEIVEQETRARYIVRRTYGEALRWLAFCATDPNHAGMTYEVWTLADDATETRMSRLAEVKMP